MVFRDLWLDHLGAEPSDCRESTVLVLTHKTTVAHHIGRQDDGEATLDGVLCH